jgi:hypothetical protein
MPIWTKIGPQARGSSTIGRDVLVAMAIKLSLLAVLYVCFFADAHRPKADPGATAIALLGKPAVNP